MRNIMKNAVIGYIHATENYPSSAVTQHELLAAYCNEYSLKLERIYSDVGNGSAVESENGFVQLPERNKGFEARRKMLQEIESGNVGTILVDSIIRLTVNASETPDLISICEERNVTIIEMKLDAPLENTEDNSRIKIAVYHFTDGSMSRQKIVEKDIDCLYSKICAHNTWILQGLYLDRTLVKEKQIKRKEVMEKAYTYDILLTKDFYHIETKTVTFWRTVTRLMNKAVKIYTLADDCLKHFYDPSCLRKGLKVAIYYRGSKLSDYNGGSKLPNYNEYRMEALKIFAELKTNWSIEKIYVDYMTKYSDKQPELEQLILDADQYNLILVDSFGMIHNRTSEFFKIKRQLKVPVYSMKEGGIYYEESCIL